MRRPNGKTCVLFVPRPASARRSGLTLLEVLLSIALIIMMLAGVCGFYMTILKAREEGGRASRDAKITRAILRRIADEIRHATSIVPGDGVGFRGDRHSITIVRGVLPDEIVYNEYDSIREDLPPAQSDLRRVTYQLLWDDELDDAEGVKLCHGLWRTEQKTFDPNPRMVMDEEDVAGMDEPGEEVDERGRPGPQPEGELIAPEVKYIEFYYFDGADWRDRWQFSEEVKDDESGAGDPGEAAGDAAGGLADLDSLLEAGGLGGESGESAGGYALPQAVRITIGRDREEPEEDDFDLSKLQNLDHNEDEEYHPDRFTVVVPIKQADRTLLSSRKYGVADSLSRQEGGTR